MSTMSVLQQWTSSTDTSSLCHLYILVLLVPGNRRLGRREGGGEKENRREEEVEEEEKKEKKKWLRSIWTFVETLIKSKSIYTHIHTQCISLFISQRCAFTFPSYLTFIYCVYKRIREYTFGEKRKRKKKRKNKKEETKGIKDRERLVAMVK